MNTARSPRRYRMLSVTLASFSGLLALRTCEAPPQDAEPVIEVAAPAPADPLLLEAFTTANVYRAGNGLPSLIWDERAAAAAAQQSTDQATSHALSHTGADGSTAKSRLRTAGYPTKWWAENAAAGYQTGTDVIWGWMNSESHARYILSPSAVHIGIGIAHAADGTSYWTMDLASGG